jgi:hypothetical protein
LVLELAEDGSEYRVVGTAEEVLPETHAQSTREKVLQAIRVLGQATRNEIEEYLREIGERITERTIKHALLGLYEDGKFEREGKGTRAEPHVYRAVNSGNRAIGQLLKELPDCPIARIVRCPKQQPTSHFPTCPTYSPTARRSNPAYRLTSWTGGCSEPLKTSSG